MAHNHLYLLQPFIKKTLFINGFTECFLPFSNSYFTQNAKFVKVYAHAEEHCCMKLNFNINGNSMRGKVYPLRNIGSQPSQFQQQNSGGIKISITSTLPTFWKKQYLPIHWCPFDIHDETDHLISLRVLRCKRSLFRELYRYAISESVLSFEILCLVDPRSLKAASTLRPLK